MTVVDTKKRSSLGEGRSQGMGFSILKKLKEDNFDAVIPHTACKDYLNDVVHCENFDASLSVYGLSYKKQGGIIDGPRSYVGMKILPQNYGGKHATFDKEVKLLDENYENIQKLLNWVEAGIGIEPTQIYKANDGYYVLDAPSYWTTQTYLISLYTLLCRLGHVYDGKKDPQEFLDNYKSTDPDYSMLHNVKPKIAKLLAGGKIANAMNKNSSSHTVHNGGIMSCSLSSIV